MLGGCCLLFGRGSTYELLSKLLKRCCIGDYTGDQSSCRHDKLHMFMMLQSEP